MPRSTVPRLTTALLLLACGPALAAGVYKWTDEKGRVHFGDRPAQEGSE